MTNPRLLGYKDQIYARLNILLKNFGTKKIAGYFLILHILPRKKKEIFLFKMTSIFNIQSYSAFLLILNPKMGHPKTPPTPYPSYCRKIRCVKYNHLFCNPLLELSNKICFFRRKYLWDLYYYNYCLWKENEKQKHFMIFGYLQVPFIVLLSIQHYSDICRLFWTYKCEKERNKNSSFIFCVDFLFLKLNKFE